MGSGTTLVAAARTERRGIGFDLDPAYVEIARARVANEKERRLPRVVALDGETPLPLPIPDSPEERIEHFQARATEEGKKAHDLAKKLLQEQTQFEIIAEHTKVKGAGVQFNFLVASTEGRRWYVDVSGAFTTVRPGLMRTDTLWKTLGRIHVVKQPQFGDHSGPVEVLVITSNLPKPGSEGDKAIRAVGPSNVFDAIEIFDTSDGGGVARLAAYATYGDGCCTVYWHSKSWRARRPNCWEMQWVQSARHCSRSAGATRPPGGSQQPGSASTCIPTSASTPVTTCRPI